MAVCGLSDRPHCLRMSDAVHARVSHLLPQDQAGPTSQAVAAVVPRQELRHRARDHHHAEEPRHCKGTSLSPPVVKCHFHPEYGLAGGGSSNVNF